MVTLENYNEKLALFMRLSKNRRMVDTFARKVNVPKLQYELEKLDSREKVPVKPKLKPMPPIPPVVVVTQPDPLIEEGVSRLKVIRNDREIRYEDLPRNLQVLWDQNRDDYKVVRQYHEKLKLMEKASDNDRKPLVTAIISMDESIRERWAKIDAYDFSQKPEIIDYRRIQANRKYLSKTLTELRTGRNSVDKVLAELQSRVDQMISNNVNLAEKTVDELKKWGVKFNE